MITTTSATKTAYSIRNATVTPTRAILDKLDNKPTNKMWIFLTIITVIIIASAISVIFIVLCYIYGGLCTCMKRMKSLICLCGLCNRLRRHKDRDSDDGGDQISMTSLTIFDIEEPELKTTLAAPKVDTLRPRYPDKNL